MKIANIATYPAREGNRLEAFQSIAQQVDVLNVALNEYTEVPKDLRKIKNANFAFPETNLKDVGKFFFNASDGDDVFLCDDDIIYPTDYVSHMMRVMEQHATDDVVFGVHGVTYSDYYDGRKRSGRYVNVFNKALSQTMRMNQLGTGTVYLKGKHLPSLKEMEGSSGFVDIRFASLLFDKSIPFYCIERDADWMIEVKNDNSLYHSVTSNLPLTALSEVQNFSGIGKLSKFGSL